MRELVVLGHISQLILNSGRSVPHTFRRPVCLAICSIMVFGQVFQRNMMMFELAESKWKSRLLSGQADGRETAGTMKTFVRVFSYRHRLTAEHGTNTRGGGIGHRRGRKFAELRLLLLFSYTTKLKQLYNKIVVMESQIDRLNRCALNC